MVVAAVALVLLFRACANTGVDLTSGVYLPSAASIQDLTVSVSGTGAIEPLHSYKVTTLVKGEVLEAPFEEGQEVRKGDLLFRIDATDVETSIEQAQLSLESARLSYQDLLDSGSYAGAREKGLVRMEGKDYVVQDGDVILFRFNV